jgi:hypothetical protein
MEPGEIVLRGEERLWESDGEGESN